MRLYNTINTKLETHKQILEVKKIFVYKILKLIIVSLCFLFLFSLYFGNYYYAVIHFIIIFFSIYELLLLKNLILDFEKNAKMIIKTGIILFFSLAYFLILMSWSKYPIVFIWFIPMPLIIYMFYNLLNTYIAILIVVIAILSILLITEYYELSDIFNQAKITRNLKNIFNFINIFFVLIIVYFVLYSIYYIKKIALKNIEKTNKVNLSEGKNQDFESKIENLYNEICTIFLNKEIFTDPEFNIQKLANILNTNVTYISISLNQKANKNFKTFLNEYRMKLVINDLSNGLHKKFTLKHIYSKAGFSSQTSFNRVFKSHLGLTPSEYLENIEEKTLL
jgi:AraC-like DNA-binding protein